VARTFGRGGEVALCDSGSRNLDPAAKHNSGVARNFQHAPAPDTFFSQMQTQKKGAEVHNMSLEVWYTFLPIHMHARSLCSRKQILSSLTIPLHLTPANISYNTPFHCRVLPAPTYAQQEGTKNKEGFTHHHIEALDITKSLIHSPTLNHQAL
jgi:hypothetical protein